MWHKVSNGLSLSNGDRVWHFVPAIKKGQAKKIASLWRGPYTIIDKVGPVNYHVQLIWWHPKADCSSQWTETLP